MVSALVACLSLMADAIPPELDAYIARPDPSFAWSVKKEGLGSLHLRMTSQTWRNVRWTHDIVVSDPPPDAQRPAPDVAILYITGGEPNKADLEEAKKLADLAKMPVALLFQIPNQPLFGMKEDDLIAHTFEQYLKEAMADPSTLGTGSSALSDWPLLFPMTKSAVRAVDALGEATKGSKNTLKRFIVTGGSKRGWTAWLTGAIRDKRVLGIAPMVFDNLNFKAQLKHQLESWGKYSEMLGDYMDRGLDKVLDTPQGSHLVAMVDPYTYRERITIPKLIVNGSNDRYWTVDALSLYWDDLKGPKYCSIVPNAGHLLGDKNQALHAIAAFARSCAGEFEMPNLVFKRIESPWIRLRIVAPVGSKASFFVTSSPNRDFRGATWDAVQGGIEGSESWRALGDVEIPKGKHSAIFGAREFQVDGLQFTLTTPVFVVK